MSDDIAAIRARWAGVRWSYEAGRDGDYVHSAMLSVGDDGDGAILLDEPSVGEQATLQLAAAAPADIRALMDWIEAARAAIRSYASGPDAAGYDRLCDFIGGPP